MPPVHTPRAGLHLTAGGCTPSPAKPGHATHLGRLSAGAGWRGRRRRRASRVGMRDGYHDGGGDEGGPQRKGRMRGQREAQGQEAMPGNIRPAHPPSNPALRRDLRTSHWTWQPLVQAAALPTHTPVSSLHKDLQVSVQEG
ncbi:hypothetical protein EXIGLDRAFT_381500 [Exidia glandulosa HHB12029]|uniref:Uncharacterized protein n=1 Tax=Exidia glandulosa HHB12029 TaxID=1314781 RepID=A0A165ZCV1_EXIGL|nr:hypothetical protein EXIGLDRAFT_381500 [Exidia glandulosa HHB12029]